jgi:hypothetical protein
MRDESPAITVSRIHVELALGAALAGAVDDQLFPLFVYNVVICSEPTCLSGIEHCFYIASHNHPQMR